MSLQFFVESGALPGVIELKKSLGIASCTPCVHSFSPTPFARAPDLPAEVQYVSLRSS